MEVCDPKKKVDINSLYMDMINIDHHKRPSCDEVKEKMRIWQSEINKVELDKEMIRSRN